MRQQEAKRRRIEALEWTASSLGKKQTTLDAELALTSRAPIHQHVADAAHCSPSARLATLQSQFRLEAKAKQLRQKARSEAISRYYNDEGGRLFDALTKAPPPGEVGQIHKQQGSFGSAHWGEACLCTPSRKTMHVHSIASEEEWRRLASHMGPTEFRASHNLGPPPRQT